MTMAYNWKKIYEEAIKVASKGGITTVDEVISFLSCEKSAFYAHFPNDSEELENIKEVIAIGKNKTKISIRKKLFDSGNPTALLALYRMICTDEERNAIVMTKADITSNGKDIQAEPITLEIIDNRDKVVKDGE